MKFSERLFRSRKKDGSDVVALVDMIRDLAGEISGVREATELARRDIAKIRADLGVFARDRLGEAEIAMPSVPVSIPQVGLFNFVLHEKSDIWISDPIRSGEIFDWQVLKYLNILIQPGDLFLDIGANIGWFTAIGSRLVQDSGRVFAIEPDPDNAKILRLNILRNSCANVTVFQMAAGERSAIANLSRSADNQGDQRLELETVRADLVSVVVRRLDDFLGPDRGCGPINVVKIDTQGSETAVIKGMKQILAASPKLRMILEFWPFGLARCGSSARALIEVLQAHSFLLWIINADGSVRPTTAVELEALASGELNPEGQRFVDLIALSDTDSEGAAALAASVSPS